jgi:hypothetical protein
MKLNILISVLLISAINLSFSIMNPYGINPIGPVLNSNITGNMLNTLSNVGGTLATPQGTQVLSPEEKEVDRLVSKWSATGPDQGQNYGSNLKNQSALQNAENEINGDRVFLNSVLNKYPGLGNSDLGNKIAQTLYVLDLQQIRLLSREITLAQPDFYNSLQAYIKKTTTRDDGNRGNSSQTNPESWYKHKKSELEALLLKFQNLLNNQSGLLQNPPPLLAGLQEALSAGSEALTLVTQQANCFTNPTDPICNIRSSNSSNSNSDINDSAFDQFN